MNILDLRTVALQRAINLLHSSGARYKIVMPDGMEYGDLQLAPPAQPAPPKRVRRYPMGAARRYYGPLIQHMKPGDIVRVPVGEFDLESLQSGICAYASANWGNQSAITRRAPEHNAVEIMRVE